jgi:hypothetical protein
MTRAPVDLLAGERARLIQRHPDVPLHVVDVTDPRWGKVVSTTTHGLWNLDPTDPRCGEGAAVGA